MKTRGFEILPEYKDLNIEKPSRSTKKAAGYDIRSITPGMIAPGESMVFETGLTAYMGESEFLGLFVRSGMAFKYDLVLQNATGIIDADYYGKHIKVKIRNEGNEVYEVKAGDRIAQGIFMPFLLTDDDHDQEKKDREDGFGHTGK